MSFKNFLLPEKPIFKDDTYDVCDFGAKGDGINFDSSSVEAAINACSNGGGGRVVFRPGIYKTGPIKLKSNVEIHFQKGCRINFSREKTDYLPCVYTNFEGVRCYNYSPLIYGNGLTNVALTGEAILDGGGDSWWDMKSVDKGVNDLYYAGSQGIPVGNRVYGSEEWGLRPCFIQILNSENVFIDGLSLINSPFWNVHPVWCKNVVISNLTIDNPISSPNTDGINIDACKNVLVEKCCVVSGGDDIFCLKSGRGRDGREVGIACENVVIRNCTAEKVNGGGFVIGSEMSGGVKNILAHDCSFGEVANGLRINTKKGRGGYVTDILCKNITVKKAKRVINICMRYAYDNQFVDSGADLIPKIADMEFENFKCDSAEYGILLEGLKEEFIKNITVKNVKIEHAKKAVDVEYVSGLNILDIDA